MIKIRNILLYQINAPIYYTDVRVQSKLNLETANGCFLYIESLYNSRDSVSRSLFSHAFPQYVSH